MESDTNPRLRAFVVSIKTDYESPRGTFHNLDFETEITVMAKDEDDARDRAKNLFFNGAASFGLPVWHEDARVKGRPVTVIEGVEEMDTLVGHRPQRAKRINDHGKYFTVVEQQEDDGTWRRVNQYKWQFSNPNTWKRAVKPEIPIYEEVDEEGEFLLRGQTTMRWNGVKWEYVTQ